MKKAFFTLILCAAMAMASSLRSEAKVTLPGIYTDNMVLQQQTTLRIRGKAEPGAAVTLKTGWSRTPFQVVTGSDGIWAIELNTPKAGGPYTLEFSDGEPLILRNVMIGEVWIGSGQSNMDQAMGGWSWGDPIKDHEKEIAGASNPLIRIFQVGRANSMKEKDEFELSVEMGGWQECAPEFARYYSAVLYFFASRLQEELKVPIGVIQAANGGTRIEAWLREEVLEGIYGCEAKVEYMRANGHDVSALNSIYESKKLLASKGLGPEPKFEENPYDANFPTTMWNALIHPLLGFPVKGILWYQGCGNVRAEDIAGGVPVKCSDMYEGAFMALIDDWRKQFNAPELPFYFFQLANWSKPLAIQPESEWADLREAQTKALRLPNTGMVVNITLGDEVCMHGPDKREQSRRMAALALNRTYGKKIECTAPSYSSYEVIGNEMHISFEKGQGAGDLVQEENLDAFIIAGADRVWHVAQARTEGNTVIVSSPEVKVPVAVRYGWADNPHCTLRTAGGFHVSPFRTDSWNIWK